MKRTHGIILIALTLLISAATTSATQTTPDFSGSWKHDGPIAPAPPPPPPSPPDTPAGRLPPPPPPQTQALAIVQTPTELRIDRTVALGERTAVYKSVYKLDGSESVNQTGAITGRTKASWEGAKLVLTTVHQIDEKILGDGREVYSLDGDKLIVESARNLPVGRRTSRSVFVRERTDR